MEIIDMNNITDEEIESLRQLDKEDLIRLFLKVRHLFGKQQSDVTN